MANKIILPEFSLIMLVGLSGSGKSSFAKKHFKQDEILSVDQSAILKHDDASIKELEIFYDIAAQRLKAGKLTIIDDTNLYPDIRKNLIQLAKCFHVSIVAIIFNLPTIRYFEGKEVFLKNDHDNIKMINQYKQLQHSIKSMNKHEGIKTIYTFNSFDELNAVEIEYQLNLTNKLDEKGPFDIIGDIHGCFDEAKQLLEKLGYVINKKDKYLLSHSSNRRIIFVGDLVDRGPNSPEILRLVMDCVASGVAFCVNGNHDNKLKRKLIGRDVTISHGLQQTLDQLSHERGEFTLEIVKFLDSLASHLIFDDGKLTVTHAGIKERYLGRYSPRISKFCMYGETTGEVDKFGLPIRYPWANEYKGNSLIVYGHTPVQKPEWINNTINIDTGCVFGGKLTALRYPEKELVSVDAKKTYYEPIKPIK